MTPNHKKLLRIYREEGLRVRRRGGLKRPLGTRAPMTIPQGPNQRWSLDFVSDSFICGRRFRILCVVDDFSRECLALVADRGHRNHCTVKHDKKEHFRKMAMARIEPLATLDLSRLNVRSRQHCGHKEIATKHCG